MQAGMLLNYILIFPVLSLIMPSFAYLFSRIPCGWSARVRQILLVTLDIIPVTVMYWLNKLEQIPPGTGSRESEIIIRYAYQDVDTITYLLPNELHAEYVPEPVFIKTKFGEYKTDYILEEGKITYIRNFTVASGIFPPDAYGELVKFYEQVVKEDNIKVVLKKET